MPGKVVQVHQRLNEATRRLSVRIEVADRGGVLHPGEFVKVAIPVGSGEPALVVPAAAIVLFNGESTVFRLQRSEEHTSELQSLMRISYAVFCLKKKKYTL